MEAGESRCTVTFGHSTFIGRALVSALLSSSSSSSSTTFSSIAVADPSHPPPVPTPNLSYYDTDFSSSSHLLPALELSSVVFHVDPTASNPTPPDFLCAHSLAVSGTRNLLEACRVAGVKWFIYTGSADVVFDGAGEVVGADESTGYPDQYEDPLNELRMQVEMLVLNADGKGGLRTMVLRPSNPFGPGDPKLVPFIFKYAKSYFSKFIIGSGNNMCDFTYVENIAHANICAGQALRLDTTSAAGKIFFITNDEPFEVWGFISDIMEGLGYQRPGINIPPKYIAIALFLRTNISKWFGLQGMPMQLLCPSAIHFLSYTRTINPSRSKRVLSYSPAITFEEGISRTVESFSELSNREGLSRQLHFGTLSKAEKFLGSGVAADILLWRDEKKTFSIVSLLFLIYYYLLLSGRTFISSLARIILLLSLSLFLHGLLPSKMFGFTLEKLSGTSFEAPDTAVKNVFFFFSVIWNKCISMMSSLAKGDDWNILFKVVTVLYILKFMTQFPLSLVIGLALSSMFLVFLIYEQYEEEADKLIAGFFATILALKRKSMSLLAHPRT